MSKRVLNMFWGIFFEKFFAQCSMEGRVFENFQKKSKIFQNSKQTQNRSHNCPNVFWTCFGVIISKIFLPSVPWWVESSKILKKIKNFSKLQKCPKSFPKVSKRDLNMFWVKFFEIFFAQCSMEGRVFENFQKSQRFLKIAKMPEIVPKSVQTCFEHVLRRFFRKSFCSVFLRESSCRKFSKKSKAFQNCRKA